VSDELLAVFPLWIAAVALILCLLPLSNLLTDPRWSRDRQDVPEPAAGPEPAGAASSDGTAPDDR
jgi:hypothetical protein